MDLLSLSEDTEAPSERSCGVASTSAPSEPEGFLKHKVGDALIEAML
jgi:hypothetical protein